MNINPISANGYALCQVPGLSIVPTFHPRLWSTPGALLGSGRSPISCDSEPRLCCSCTPTRSCPMFTRRRRSTCTPTLCGSGGDDGHRGIFSWKTTLDGGAKLGFPPLDHALVKAGACELVHATHLPLSRLSTTDVAARAAAALGKPISPRTVWRMLAADAIKPWQYRYWIFPRDPDFAAKAGHILDLYAGSWHGAPLSVNDHIISADEKTSIQARIRCHPSLPPAPGRAMRIEHEDERGGALQYLAAWDVRRGVVMGRCAPSTGIAPFGRLVAHVMEREPYCSAERVFWSVDNGSSPRGQTAVRRLAKAYANLIVVHTPVHASWLNQVEISVSIVQRKVLTPNDFASLEDVEQRLRLYEVLSNQQPRAFEWQFTRAKLVEFLKRLEAHGVRMDSCQTVLEVPNTNQGKPLAA
jgi:hypothetical protein